MSTKTVLTAAQIKANRTAIHSYIIKQTIANGGLRNHPVILLPEFVEQQDGSWAPVEGNGVRITKKEGLSFTRLGMAFLKDDMTAGFLYTNTLGNNDAVTEGLLLLGVSVGDAIPGKVLVVQESLTPFRTTNPELDLKVFPESGIPCTLDDQPIYRRVVNKPVGTLSTFIQHNNNEQQRAFQQSRLQTA